MTILALLALFAPQPEWTILDYFLKMLTLIFKLQFLFKLTTWDFAKIAYREEKLFYSKRLLPQDIEIAFSAHIPDMNS